VLNTYNRLDNLPQPEPGEHSPYSHIHLRDILILSHNSALDQHLVVGF